MLKELKEKETRGHETQWLMYRHYWRHFVTCPRVLPVYMIKLFSGNKQNLWPWDYGPQVLDYQDFWISICWIKGILL
jgi:hypothetical protein